MVKLRTRLNKYRATSREQCSQGREENAKENQRKGARKGVVKLGCFCAAAARGTCCSNWTVHSSLTWLACVCGHYRTAHQKHTKCNYDQEETQSIYHLFLEVFACMLYTRNNDVNFTTPRQYPVSLLLLLLLPSVQHQKKKTNKQENNSKSTIKLHCSECCPVGFVDVVVAAGQCSHPRLKEPAVFTVKKNKNAISTGNYFSSFSHVLIQYVYMHPPLPSASKNINLNLCDAY